MTKTACPYSALFAFSALCITLTACSTGPLQPATAAGTTTLPSGGVYKGIVPARGNAILVMLFDGTAYLFYGAGSPAMSGLGGVVVATNGSQSASGRFTSTSAQNYNLQSRAASPVTFDADFARAPAVTGSARTQSGESLTFSATSDQMLGADPARATVAGLYTGRGGSLQGATNSKLTVTGDGFLAGTTGMGCVFKGTVAPHSGVNAYDVSITFGPAPCPQSGTTLTGTAVLDGARLLAALPLPGRSDAFVFDGTK